MSTNYPGALDDHTVLENTRINTTLTINDHATQHNNISDAVVAVETELGTNPKGSYTDVKTRLNDSVVKTPTAGQLIVPGGDYTGIAVKANVALATANVYEGQNSAGVIKYFVDKNFKVSAQGFQIGGVDLAASNLSNGVTGSGAVVLAVSPALTGSPTAPTATIGDNSTKIATTAFVQAAAPAAGTSGTLAAIPAPSAASGRFYYATDQVVLYWSNGTAWTRMGLPAGYVGDWMAASGLAPAGWVLYDGGTLAGSTGIYADLFAHLGNTTTLPDSRGRTLVGRGTHTDVASVGASDGIATVANRRPKHRHTVAPGTASGTTNGPDETVADSGSSSIVTGVGAYNGTGALGTHTHTFSAVVTGTTVGPQTGAEPIDSAAYLVTLKIAKL